MAGKAPPASGEVAKLTPLRAVLTPRLIASITEEAPTLVRSLGLTHIQLRNRWDLTPTQWKRLLAKNPSLKDALSKQRRLRALDKKAPSQMARSSALVKPKKNLLINESDETHLDPYSAEWLTPYLQHLRDGMSRSEALDLLGVLPTELLEVQAKNSAFREACDNERLRVMFQIEDNAMQRALEEKAEAKMFLEAYFPQVFKPKTTNINKGTQITNNQPGPMQFNFDPSAIKDEARSIEAAKSKTAATQHPEVASMQGRSWVRKDAERDAEDWLQSLRPHNETPQ